MRVVRGKGWCGNKEVVPVSYRTVSPRPLAVELKNSQTPTVRASCPQNREEKEKTHESDEPLNLFLGLPVALNGADLRKRGERVVDEHVHAAMVCAQVVDLLLVQRDPDVLADKLDEVEDVGFGRERLRCCGGGEGRWRGRGKAWPVL